MQLPTRTLLPLAAVGLLGFIAVGILAADQGNEGAAGDIREQSVTVPLADGFPLAVRLFEPRGSASIRPAVLVGLPADGTRSILARALARRGWSVAVVDLRGTGASVGSGTVPVGVTSSSARWADDLAEIGAWIGALPNVTKDPPALIALRAAASPALQAKGSGDRFGSLAVVLPLVPTESNSIGTLAYRTTPAGVLVLESPPFTLPATVQGFLTEPTRTERIDAVRVADIADDPSTLAILTGWLENPTDGA